ncbi:hypothetical protein, partial [Kitasatospora sp. NPDC059571]|uniref:hypothetical protein n=1 Tax=Kitasatospora sp. NPDC059571 TaxID=3346871 RepID=UPI00369104A6
MTDAYGGAAPIPTRFGLVPAGSAVPDCSEEERAVLAAAGQRGLRAVDWLLGLAAPRPDTEAGS